MLKNSRTDINPGVFSLFLLGNRQPFKRKGAPITRTPSLYISLSQLLLKEEPE